MVDQYREATVWTVAQVLQEASQALATEAARQLQRHPARKYCDHPQWSVARGLLWRQTRVQAVCWAAGGFLGRRWQPRARVALRALHFPAS